MVGATHWEQTGENLKDVWAEFSTLRWAVIVMSVISKHTQARSNLQLKTQPRQGTLIKG